MATQSPGVVPPLALSLLFFLAVGPGAIFAEPDGTVRCDREELLGYTRDTWKSVAAMGDCAELPVIVPSWDGSMFEGLVVTLFVPEELWAPRSWGVNHPLYVRTKIEFGLEGPGYGYWGFSPAFDPEEGYRTYGVDALGSDPLGYRSNDDKSRIKTAPSAPKGRLTDGVVAPYASFLALRFAPREAMDNLRKLKENFPIYWDHGFMDSVNISTGVVADRVLILDQGMILAAIANALANDAMRTAFIDRQSERVLRPLMAPEEFTAGVAPPAPPIPPAASRARAARHNPPEKDLGPPSSEPEE